MMGRMTVNKIMRVRKVKSTKPYQTDKKNTITHATEKRNINRQKHQTLKSATTGFNINTKHFI